MLAGQYPGRRVRGAAPARHLGSRRGHGPARRDARTVAVTSGGTIPDRGLFPVFLADDATGGRGPDPGRAPGRRAAAAGASASWTRRWSTRRARGRSSCSAPAPGASNPSSTTGSWSRRRPGEPGKVPFWKGDGVGRPVELGRALGAFTREIGELAGGGHARPRAGPRAGSASTTTSTSWRPPTCSPTWRRSARSRGALPTDRTIVLQRFRDELGDWRVCLLSPVRGAGPRAVGAGHRGAAARDARRRGAAHLVRRRHRRAPAGRPMRPSWPRRPTRDRLATRPRSPAATALDGRQRRRPCSSPRTRSRSW